MRHSALSLVPALLAISCAVQEDPKDHWSHQVQVMTADENLASAMPLDHSDFVLAMNPEDHADSEKDKKPVVTQVTIAIDEKTSSNVLRKITEIYDLAEKVLELEKNAQDTIKMAAELQEKGDHLGEVFLGPLQKGVSEEFRLMHITHLKPGFLVFCIHNKQDQQKAALVLKVRREENSSKIVGWEMVVLLLGDK